METGGRELSKNTNVKENTITIEMRTAFKSEFDILTAASRKGLVKLVNEKLAEGFELCGQAWPTQKVWIVSVIKRRDHPTHQWEYTTNDETKVAEESG